MDFLFLCSGLLIFLYGLKGLHLRWKSDKWLQTEGTVIQSDICPVVTSYGYNGKMYPTIKYGYEVKGRQYLSYRIFASGMITRNYSFYNLINELPSKNEKVTVFYDPNHPEKACLKKDDYLGAFSCIFFGIAFILIAAYIFYIQ